MANKISSICKLLEKEYGKPEWTYKRPVLDELIYTIISQNTTAKNCNEAYTRLCKQFPVWKDILSAKVEDIAEAIKPAGLANIRAPRIQNLLKEINNKQGNLDLEWIRDVPDQKALDYLMKFEGVGRKTAACTLMFALNRPVMPVDTHVHRVATRLGLIRKTSADAAHGLLQDMLKPDDIYPCHMNLVTHGRKICHARNPKCLECVLRKECEYIAK